MNYCTKCQSIYQTPGTCNCFAKVTVQPPLTPWVPIPGTTTVPFIPWSPAPSIGNPFWNISTSPFYNISGGNQTQTDAMGNQYTFTA